MIICLRRSRFIPETLSQLNFTNFSFLALAIASKKLSIAIYVHVTQHAPWKIFTEPWKPEFQPWTAKFVFWELFLTI